MGDDVFAVKDRYNPEGLISQLSLDARKRYFVVFMEIGTLLAGLLCLAAGVLGVYWGSHVIKPWPPATWNNCVGAWRARGGHGVGARLLCVARGAHGARVVCRFPRDRRRRIPAFGHVFRHALRLMFRRTRVVCPEMSPR